MLIDWFTVGAQVLNFLALVWLLKRFLYKPVLSAIDARETLVAAELAGAATARAEAQKDGEAFRQKGEAFDRDRAALMTKATDDAKAQAKRLADDAADAADAAATQRQNAIRTDADHLRQAIARRTQDEVFAIARKTLTDLASATLEDQMVAVFARRLHDLDAAAAKQFADAVAKPPGGALVRTAFDLPAGPRAAVQDAVNRALSADVAVRYETAPDLIGGIELTAGGQKLAWSIGDYLASLASGVDELVGGRGATPPSRPIPIGPAVVAKAG